MMFIVDDYFKNNKSANHKKINIDQTIQIIQITENEPNILSEPNTLSDKPSPNTPSDQAEPNTNSDKPSPNDQSDQAEPNDPSYKPEPNNSTNIILQLITDLITEPSPNVSYINEKIDNISYDVNSLNNNMFYTNNEIIKLNKDINNINDDIKCLRLEISEIKSFIKGMK
jgi:hypothetical protein